MILNEKIINFFLKNKKLFALILIAIFIGIGASVIYRGALSPHQRTDFTVFLRAADTIYTGEHMYGVENIRHWHYVYLPLFAVMLSSVVPLPLIVNITLWYMFSIISLIIVWILSFKIIENKKEAAEAILLSSILCVPVFLNTLTRGQLGIFSIFLAISIFLLYIRKYRFLTGLLFSFALVLKISPIAYIGFFFLFRKEWKILLSALFGCFIFICVVPSLVLGFETNWNLILDWTNIMQSSTSSFAHKSYLWGELLTPFASDNQSIYSVLTRTVWSSENEFIKNSNWLIKSVSLLLNCLGLFLLWLLSKKKCENNALLFAEYSLFPMLMLFASPVSQIHHYTFLYLLFLSSFIVANNITKNVSLKFLILAGVLFGAFSYLFGLIFSELSYLGIPLWGSLILWLVLLINIKITGNTPLKN